MNILEEIKNDHDKVRELMLQVENQEDDAMLSFKEMAALVLGHHNAEEHIVFPKLSKDCNEVRLNLIAEHDALRRSIQFVLDTPEQDPNWKARFHVVKDLFFHHIQEEEEQLFEALRDEMDQAMLEALTGPFERHEHKAQEEMMECVDRAMILTEKDIAPLSSKLADSRRKRGTTKSR